MCQINTIKYYLHRLIWVFNYGEILDDKLVDHINRNKSDNNIENLRLVDYRGNAMNKKFKASNTGIYGVTKDREYYKVSFTINNKSTHVGSFKLLEDAKSCAELYIKNNKIDV